MLANRIIQRKHFRELYRRNPDDIGEGIDAASAIYKATSERFGANNVRLDQDSKGGGNVEFPVLSRDGRIISSVSLSQILGNLPEAAIDYVFVEPNYRNDAVEWLKRNRRDIIENAKEEDRGSIE